MGIIADEEENKCCEWRIVDMPHGLPVYNTSCGNIRLSCAKGYDIYCNGCGRKIKVIDDLKVSDSE